MKLTAKDDAMQVGSVQCRAHTGTNFTLVNLQKVIRPALDSASTELISKCARECRDYEQAHKVRHKAGKRVEKAVMHTNLTGGF